MPDASNTDFSSLTALVVDDYDSMRSRLAAALKALGVTVTETVNGVEAMNALKNSAFDLVITDIVMPEMDGFELCEEVRKTPGLLDLPVIVTSTHCDTHYIVKALRLGADDYLPKPLDANLLKRVLARVMTPNPVEASHG